MLKPFFRFKPKKESNSFKTKPKKKWEKIDKPRIEIEIEMMDQFNCSRVRDPRRRESHSPWEWYGPRRCCTTSGYGSCQPSFPFGRPPASSGRRWCHPRCTSPAPSSQDDRSAQPRSSSLSAARTRSNPIQSEEDRENSTGSRFSAFNHTQNKIINSLENLKQ